MKTVTFPRTTNVPSGKSVAVCCSLGSSAEGSFRRFDMNEKQKGREEYLGVLGKKDQTRTTGARNLKRRSSIQKIIHICSQSYRAVPHLYLWVQDFQSSLLADFRKIIPAVRSILVLRLMLYLCIAFLSAELVYCFVTTLTLLMPSGSVFFFFCIGVLSLLAFQIFDVALGLRKKLGGTFFVKKKVN